jgi:hypothetical protein
MKYIKDPLREQARRSLRSQLFSQITERNADPLYIEARKQASKDGANWTYQSYIFNKLRIYPFQQINIGNYESLERKETEIDRHTANEIYFQI